MGRKVADVEWHNSRRQLESWQTTRYVLETASVCTQPSHTGSCTRAKAGRTSNHCFVPVILHFSSIIYLYLVQYLATVCLSTCLLLWLFFSLFRQYSSVVMKTTDFNARETCGYDTQGRASFSHGRKSSDRPYFQKSC